MPFDIDKIRGETPGIKNATHLLASGSSLMPRVVIDAIIDHTVLEGEFGGYEAQSQVSARMDRVYDGVARHIGAKPREIALMENASVAWAHAFYAIPIKPKSRILTCEAEYAANFVAILQRAKKNDLTVEVIPSDETGALDLNALELALGEDVGLIAITWVPTNGGLVNPASGVGKIARKHSIPYLLDACQAAGQLRIDVDEIGCDFLSATGRKFLRGPRGTGFLYVRENWLDGIEPTMIDHFGAPWVATDRYELRDDARRFETWENSYALRAGLGAAIDYMDGIGIEAISERVSNLAQHCRTLLTQIERFEVRDLGSKPCGIVSFTSENQNPDEIVKEMAREGIIIGSSPASSTRLDANRRNLPTVLRIAPHYYNTHEEIERAVKHLENLV